MARTFIFPGQGSQAVGMGRDLAAKFPEARAVFEEVDHGLHQSLSHLMFEGPVDKLVLTANAQPALMAVSMAVMRVVEARGHKLADLADYVAGHSLGEYSALCAAGTFSLADAARLLRIRGNAMQSAVPAGEGAMAAIIGLEADEVIAACDEASEGASVCQIANDNGGGQLVISGLTPAVEHAARICTEKGAKRAVMLPVSAPFHSELMQPAAERIRDALADIEMKDPVVPLVSNVEATAVSDAERIRQLLVEQVTGRVRWAESVSWLAANGVDTLVEVGAGRVLSGLARRIDRNLATVALGTPADIDAFLASLDDG
ncbi:ACP S-malonyltransferase [Pseudohoeflea coraliihabitans]|uniref:Malonyl CoA-acyl carrier protein transacylase n=1 Tax=Pseudohoeflea coraliihabitans TaxID=2860393 RepID=A0ABS6WRV9_9HYPH|nr:ACP S-malonyltransferase [Pseudohoeflea sp. DP4N28-3]MBW3098701.1 ACP S-malonyltransferase [Pseudohoeflea sp. DP4N28-3]